MHDLSLVTEGDDKPLKYPDMFHAAGLMLLNKIDLRPYVDLGVERYMRYARQMNPAFRASNCRRPKAIISSAGSAG